MLNIYQLMKCEQRHLYLHCLRKQLGNLVILNQALTDLPTFFHCYKQYEIL